MSAAMKTHTVLLVDDDIHNQKIFETVLRHSGFQVRQAGNGEDALREARASARPDLMDLSIPVIDGWECTRQLKADEYAEHHHFGAYRACDAWRRGARAGNAGCDGYLSKPISPRKLVEEVKSRLQVTRGALPS